MHWIGIKSTKLNLTPICDITRIISCRQIIATTESIQSNACYAIRDGDRGKGGAISESPISNGRDAVRDGDRGERFALVESLLTNARHWAIEGDDTLAVFVLVANDISTKDIGFIWSDDITIGGGISDLPRRVNTIFLHKLANIFCPIRCLVCSLCATWDIGGGEIRWESIRF